MHDSNSNTSSLAEVANTSSSHSHNPNQYQISRLEQDGPLYIVYLCRCGDSSRCKPCLGDRRGGWGCLEVSDCRKGAYSPNTVSPKGFAHRLLIQCPYYDHAKAIVKQPDGESAEHPDCPLKTKGCPYYDQHKGDKKLADALVTENDDCPLAGKCKFYAEIKEGKVDSVNFDKADCPLSGNGDFASLASFDTYLTLSCL